MKRNGWILSLLSILLVIVLVGCGNGKKIGELIQQGDDAYAQGDYEAAVAAYDEILELDAERDEIYNNRGMAKLNMGDYKAAANDFSKAIELESNTDIYYNNRGLVYYYQGEYEKALPDFAKGVELNGGDATYFSNRGDVYSSLGRYNEALADYNEALRLDDTKVTTINNRASVYFKQEKYEEAIADYTLAIEKEPAGDVVYWNRGEAHRMLGQYEEALADYNRYIQNAPAGKTVDFLFKRAEVLTALEDYDAAIEDFTTAITLEEDNMLLYQGRANVYNRKGAYKEAIKDFDRFLEKTEDAIALGNRGYCHFQLEEYEQALSDLNRCIELKQDYAWAYYTRGQILQKLTRYEEAKADYDKANALTDE